MAKPSIKLTPDFDPDGFRMSVGDHLEELRWRLILALGGVAAGFCLCLLFVQGYVLPWFCRPLIAALLEAGTPPQTYFKSVTGPFFIYLKVSAVVGLALTSPWVLWQFWQFVAAGLYPKERRTVTRYIPLSMALLLSGLAGAYYVILPLTLSFFIGFGLDIPMPVDPSPVAPLPADVVLPVFPPLDADPAEIAVGEAWYNRVESRIKYFDGVDVHTLGFQSNSLATPLIELPDYVNLVMMLLVVFGLCFQLPLVVLGVAAAGIVTPEDLAANRKYVIFALAVAAALLTPADPLSMILLAIPLAGLYELGLFLARRSPPSDR